MRAWAEVPVYLTGAVTEHLRRRPRFRSFRPALWAGFHVKLALAERQGELFVAHSKQMDVYATAEPGRLLRRWTINQDSSTSSVRVFANPCGDQIAVIDGRVKRLYAGNGTLLEEHGEIWPWVPLCVDFAHGGVYSRNRRNIEVQTLAGDTVRTWPAVSPLLQQMVPLGEDLVVASTAAQLGVYRADRGTLVHCWPCENVWDFCVQGNTVLALCNGSIHVFRLCDGASVGVWPAARHMNFNAVIATQDGRIVASSGHFVFVSQ